jgi:outer membrane protein assembly factor BamB
MVYRMKAFPDGKSVLCGTAGGHVLRVSENGTVLWRTDLHPGSIGNVDELFSCLASAQEVPCGPSAGRQTEFEALKSNVPLSGNLLSPTNVPNSWSGTGFSAVQSPPGGSAALEMADGGVARQTVRQALQPFSTYVFVVAWRPERTDDVLELSAAIAEEDGERLETRRPNPVSNWESMMAVLPVKTGPKPVAVTVQMAAATKGRIRVQEAGLFQAEFGGPNVGFVPSAYLGNTKEARAEAGKSLNVIFRHLEGNLQEAVQVEPIEMLNGRIARKDGSRWMAGEMGQMGGVEVTFREPKTIGTVVFYDDPAHPKTYMRQYLVEYWEQKDTPKEEKPAATPEEKVDEIQFTDVWKGDWKAAVVERDSRSPIHVHRLPIPLTSTRFRVSGLLNLGGPPRDEDTRITEFELYEVTWPTAGGSALRTYSCQNGRIDGQFALLKQRFLADRRFGSGTSIFAGGDMYLACGSVLSAISMGNFTTRWTFKVKEERAIRSAPTIAGKLVLFGSDDYELRAVNRETGELVWSFPTDYVISGSPCVVGKSVYFGSGDGFVYALKCESGEKLWEFETGQPIRSSVASDGEGVYFSSFDHSVYALDPATGAKKWSYKTGGPIRSGVAVGKEAVFVGSDDGGIYALRKATGELLWKHTTGGYVEASPALDEDSVYIGSLDGVFRRLDQKTGKPLWQEDLKSPVRGAALVLGPHVLFYADDCILRKVDRETGNEQAQIAVPGGRCLTDITPVGGMLVIGTRQGYFLITGGGPAK